MTLPKTKPERFIGNTDNIPNVNWQGMQVGDFYVIGQDTINRRRHGVDSIRKSAANANQRYHSLKKFSVHKMEDSDGAEYFVLWRKK